MLFGSTAAEASAATDGAATGAASIASFGNIAGPCAALANAREAPAAASAAGTADAIV